MNLHKLTFHLMIVLQVSLLNLFSASPTWAAEHCSDNYYIDVTLPNQARWDMCWEHRQREGIVLHKIYYTPADGERRMVLNEAAVAQIHVPYDDNGARYHDVSDYGLGGGYMSRLTQADCPNGSLLAFNSKSVVCQNIELRDSAYAYDNDRLQGNALSLFSVSKIGAYNYIPVWRFLDDGSIEPGMGATGALQRFGNTSKEAHGWLIGDNKIGLAHLHNFFWKLDFDLAGTADNDYVEELNFQQDNGHTERQNTRFTTEQARKVSPQTLRRWRVVDGELKNNKGQAISYEIRLHQAEHQDIGPESEPFTHNDFYVTQQNSCELFASHNPTVNNCADNLAAFVNDQNLEGKDIVVWPSTTFYHMPRSEDAPIMDAHWSFISITPRDWHDKNPLSDSAEANSSSASSSSNNATPDNQETTNNSDSQSDSDSNTNNTPQVTTTTIYRSDFETSDNKWRVNSNGRDTASKGQWEIANPQQTAYRGAVMQRGTTPSGNKALVTGGRAGQLVGTHDVDGGKTSIRSPAIDLESGAEYRLKLSYYLSHLKNTTDSDFLRITAIRQGGGYIRLLNITGTASVRAAQWRTLNKDISRLAGSRIYLLIEAADGGAGSIVEAAVDNIRIEKTTTTSTPNADTETVGTRGDRLYSENFEGAHDWTINPTGDDNAHAGHWESGTPQPTQFQGINLQVATAASGNGALITGKAAGNLVGSHDIDGGKTSIRSPKIQLPANNNFRLTLDYYFAHLWNTTSADYLTVSIETLNGQRREIFRQTGVSENRRGEWKSTNSDLLSEYSGQTVYLVVEAADGGAGSLVEAGIDNIQITYQ